MQLKYSVGQICTDQVVDGFAAVFGALLGQGGASVGLYTSPSVLDSTKSQKYCHSLSASFHINV